MWCPLSPEQQILKNMVFRNFTHVETRALLALAKWQEVAAGSLLIAEITLTGN